MQCKAESSYITGRGIMGYEEFLTMSTDNFSPSDVILDIGGGIGNFQEQCNKKGLNVIGIDGRYCLHRRSDKLIAKERKDLLGSLGGDLEKFEDELKFRSYMGSKKGSNFDRKIAAINENIPLKGSSVDYVISNFSSFYYLCDNYRPEERVDAAKVMFSEALRVLKPSGEIMIGGLKDRLYFSDVLYLDKVLKLMNLPENIKWEYGTSSAGFGDYLKVRKL